MFMRTPLAFLLTILLPVPVWAQSIMEFGDLRAGAAGTGAGAGLSVGMGQKNAVKNSFEKATRNMTQAQKAAFEAQTQAINQYWAAGCKYEVSKQWSNAEKTFAYVLNVITLRDGAKSPSRVPVLQRLVTATKAQKKLDKAIQYQKSIVDFHKSVSRPDERIVVRTQKDLTGLYLDKQDYSGAESVLKDSVALYAKYPTLPANDRIVTLKTYSTVLRKLKKNVEADKIEKGENPVSAVKNIQAVPPPPSPSSVKPEQAIELAPISQPATEKPALGEPSPTGSVPADTKAPDAKPVDSIPVESVQPVPAESAKDAATPLPASDITTQGAPGDQQSLPPQTILSPIDSTIDMSTDKSTEK